MRRRLRRSSAAVGIEFITRWFLKQLLHDRAPTPVRLVRPSLSYTNHLIAKQARAADRREGRPVALASACLGVILLRGAVNKKPDMVASEAKLALPLQSGPRHNAGSSVAEAVRHVYSPQTVENLQLTS